MQIINYTPQHKTALMTISLEWLEKYNVLEDIDIEMLRHPERIWDGGGHIFLAKNDAGEIVGMVMLENNGPSYELLKLGVLESAQGQGAANLLLDRAISQARADGKEQITLCSNHQLSAALHLYEKFGFQYIQYEQNHFELSDISMVLAL